MNRGNKGVVDVGLLLVVALAGALATGHLTLPAFLQKKPPTAQLTQAEKDLASAKAAQASAEAKLAKIEADRQAVKDKQLDYTQEMVGLGLTALNHAGDALEVKIAREAVLRADAGFEAARGKLSPEARAEIQTLFDGAIAAKNHEIEVLRASLVAKDDENARLAGEKAALDGQIPTLRADVEVAKAQTATVEAKTTTLVKQVEDYANKMADERAKAGGWEAYFWLAVKLGLAVVLAMGGFYLFAHIWLPSMGQSYPGSLWERLAILFKNTTTTHD